MDPNETIVNHCANKREIPAQRRPAAVTGCHVILSQPKTMPMPMRIECPHCHHQGFSALQKLRANPLKPVTCRYCHRRSYPHPALSGAACLLGGALLGIGWLAFTGSTGGWMVAAVGAALVIVTALTVLRPGRIANSVRIKRDRIKLAVLAIVATSALLGLVLVVQMYNSAPAVSG